MMPATSPAVFVASDPAAYEVYMGRWTRRLTAPFLEFVGVRSGHRVLDVGCGTGIMTAACADLGATVVGLDPAAPYLEFARCHAVRPNASFELGDAHRIGYPDGTFDAAVSTLVLDVIPDPEKVGQEMRRVTRPGGIVASAVHDFRGAFAPMFMMSDLASVLDSGAQAVRDGMLAHPLVWPEGQAKMWCDLGLLDVVEVPLVIPFEYTSFGDYWSTFETGQGRFGGYVMGLPDELRGELKRHVRIAYLAGMPDGPRSFSVIIRAARGVVPGRG
jgi:SAM-dependent methyltransferase